MNARFTPFISLLILSFFIIYDSEGQETLSDFGKNRIQYKDFNWRYYSTENFDIYFYRGGADNAKLAAKYLEEDYLRMTDIIGYAPYSKTKIFLYNSVADLHQSNVGVNENNYTVGGQTNFVQSQVELAYPGTNEAFKNVLQLKIAKMLLDDMMFGGSLSDMFQSTYLLNLPSWFLDGAALYIAKGWSIEMDDYMRDLLEDREIKKLVKLEGKAAEMAGQSVWNFIAEQYGSSNISNILNLTRIIRNEESSIANTLGIPFKRFMAEWQGYYKEMAAQVRKNYVPPPEENRVSGKSNRGYIYNKVKISPDGNYLAYTKNLNGKFWIMVKDLNSGKEKKVFTGGHKAIGQEIDENIPLIAWKDNSTLGIIASKKGNTVLWLYNLDSDSKLKKDLHRFNQVSDFSFSESGGVAVLSADMNGQNDIFLLGVRRNRLKRVTNDLYDDVNPKFVPNTEAIIFASNRDTDSLRGEAMAESLEEITDNYNLFLYDIDTTRDVLVRVTNTISKDINPLPLDQNTIYYLSDQKGIYNLFKYSIPDSLYTQITNYQMSIRDYDIHPENNKLAFIMLNEGKEKVYYVPGTELNESNFTFQTPRQQIMQAKYISNKFRERRKKKAEEEEADTVSQEQNTDDMALEGEAVPKDTLPPGFIDTDNYVFGTEVEDQETPTGIIDTDDYVFDQEAEQQEEHEATSFLSRFRKLRTAPSEINGPFDYEPRFSADNIVVSWVVDPLIGFGIKGELEMNDMLENHKIYGGVMATTNLKSANIYGEYHYLKYLIDFRARFERNSIFYEKVFETDLVRQRYTLNKFEVGASYPLSVTSRFSFNPFYATTRYVDLNEILLTPGRNNENTNVLLNYVGARGEFVFDNTLLKGLNLFQGTKGKISYTFYQNIESTSNNFSRLQFELRHYQKISREITLAGRLFYGRFMGNAPKSYMLGGMNNAILSRDTNILGVNDPLYAMTGVNSSDLLFNQFVTNLRGFDYNKFNGTNTVLLNVELRLPIIKYFVNGPIASNFFRNLQFIGFYDIGSAWTGSLTPYDDNSSVNTEIIKSEGSPFVAKLKNFRNPWLQSYGTGVRTVLLGYYLKFDVAWPIEDYQVKSPKFYLSLGFDF